MQQTPNPFAQDPDEVPPLFVHSDLRSKAKLINIVPKAMPNYFSFSNSLSKRVRKLSIINESSLSKIFASFKLAKITET